MAVRTTLEHAAIDQLAGTPDVMRALLAAVTPEQAEWKPAPERFSIAELLEHLSHIEGHMFRRRFDQMVTEDNPEVEPYDQNDHYAQGTYSNRDAEESMAHWEEQRENNVDFLRGLGTEVLARTARHRVFGKITLENVLNEWAIHDLGHVRQMAELVRTRLFYPGLGPFQEEYSLRP